MVAGQQADLLYVHCAAATGSGLYIMDADGKNVKEITTAGNPNGFVYPAWSPDGKKIAYAHPAAGGLEIGSSTWTGGTTNS